MEEFGLEVGECFPTSTNVSFVFCFFLLKLLCALKGELSRLGLLTLYIPKKFLLALVLACDHLLGDKLSALRISCLMGIFCMCEVLGHARYFMLKM